MSLMEERDTQKVYTGSLLNQELHPVPEATGNPLSNQNILHTKPPKK